MLQDKLQEAGQISVPKPKTIGLQIKGHISLRRRSEFK